MAYPEQQSLFAPATAQPSEPVETPELNSYDIIVVGFSGGKDSLACVLELLEQGVPKERIELWHHLVDGREGNPLMDWPITEAYCEAFAKAFGLKLFYSWKEGGFRREMLREDALTAPIRFETPEGVMQTGGTRGKLSTRRKFPQVTADLSTRWCSAYLKIDVAAAAIRNDLRFAQKRTLVVTGERAEESAARAKYKMFEPDRSDLRNGRTKRHVDHWRPVHGWSEAEVWDIIAKYGVVPHPAYRMGFGRCSCMACIFGSANQWATIQCYAPERFEEIACYEEEFGVTIQRNRSVRELAAMGKPYPVEDPAIVELALSEEYTEAIIVETWTHPAGAFGESAGPT